MDWPTNAKKRKLDIVMKSNDVEDEEDESKPMRRPQLGKDDASSVTSINNHIYFYTEVNRKSILKLNQEIRAVSLKMQEIGLKFGNAPSIHLHINSYGGSVHAAMAGIDEILNCKVPIITIIEGCAASAATMLSVVGSERWMTEHAHMLIHQLSSSMWGQMDDLEEEMDNLKSLMKTIKSIYKKHTKIPSSALDQILKHDQWWKASKCLSKGLVDKII